MTADSFFTGPRGAVGRPGPHRQADPGPGRHTPAAWYGGPPPGPHPEPVSAPAFTPGQGAEPECVCGRVCVCAVPVSVVRSVASFVAEWHPTVVADGDPDAGRAEDATVCRCGQAFCGYRILARTMRRHGAYTRA